MGGSVSHRIRDGQIKPTRPFRKILGNADDVAGEVVAAGRAAGFFEWFKSPFVETLAGVIDELKRGVDPCGVPLRRLIAGKILQFEIDDQLLPGLEAAARKSLD